MQKKVFTRLVESKKIGTGPYSDYLNESFRLSLYPIKDYFNEPFKWFERVVQTIGTRQR